MARRVAARSRRPPEIQCLAPFRVLREAALVRTRSDGVAHMNALRRAELDQRLPGLLAAILEPVVVPAEATQP